MSDLQISKSDMAMIHTSGHGLSGVDRDQFVGEVLAHLRKIGDPLGRSRNGFPDHSTPHVRSAVTAVLSREKQ